MTSWCRLIPHIAIAIIRIRPDRGKGRKDASGVWLRNPGLSVVHFPHNFAGLARNHGRNKSSAKAPSYPGLDVGSGAEA